MLKNDFIGTAAWIFLVINLFKLTFQVIFWKNITQASLQIDLLLLPPLLVGFLIGIKLVKKKLKMIVTGKVVFLLTLIFIGAVFILFKK